MPRVKLDSDLNHDMLVAIKEKFGFDVSLQVVKACRWAEKECMIKRVMKYGYCYLANFFGISIVERKPRMTRNPKTGEKIQLPARKKLKVKLAKEFRKINL
jgi:nucleoid DNA-binding protein